MNIHKESKPTCRKILFPIFS